MKMRWPLILTIVGAASCGETPDRISLADRVDRACDLLTSDLANASKKYLEYAGWMAAGRLSPDQQARAEMDLLYGTTERERRVAGNGVHMQLRFCASTRDIDDSRSSTYLTRAAEAVEKFQWGTGAQTATRLMEVADPTQIATGIREIADLAAEINALPIRD